MYCTFAYYVLCHYIQISNLSLIASAFDLSVVFYDCFWILHLI